MKRTWTDALREAQQRITQGIYLKLPNLADGGTFGRIQTWILPLTTSRM
jgi:hypothetical protein